MIKAYIAQWQTAKRPSGMADSSLYSQE
jgi:hypothetical protein